MTYQRNDFGKFSATFRVEHDLLLRDFAEKLGVSSSFLSNVEHGRKPIPDDWFERIGEYFDLSLPEKSHLKVSILRSQSTFSITVKNEAELQIMVAFMENRDNINHETSKRIVRAVRNEEEEEFREKPKE